jgi:hypothetical protein
MEKNNADEIIKAVEPFSNKVDLEAFTFYKLELLQTERWVNTEL